MTTKRIMIVDDHPVVRSSLAKIISKISAVTLVGETGSGKICLRLARKMKPDLVILDYKLPDISGLEVTRRLLKQDPEIKILALTAEEHLVAKNWLFEAGVHAYLNKSASAEKIATTIKTILERTGQIINDPRPIKTAFGKLTAREAEIMCMMIYGDNMENIAQRLNLDVKTIYTYRSAILKKMQVKNVIELTLRAWQEGIF